MPLTNQNHDFAVVSTKQHQEARPEYFQSGKNFEVEEAETPLAELLKHAKPENRH